MHTNSLTSTEVAQGPPSFIAAEPASLTGQYLSGTRRIEAVTSPRLWREYASRRQLIAVRLPQRIDRS